MLKNMNKTILPLEETLTTLKKIEEQNDTIKNKLKNVVDEIKDPNKFTSSQVIIKLLENL